ncbi:phospholipase A1 1 [Anabrus simplex]|uniref:phospholipase A1 1 n=1 Tax=Anabrus simplex TaxID=316456 RepID=UPI0035A395C0
MTHPNFNKSSCIVMYSPGYTRGPDSFDTMEIIDAYLENGNYNLFINDWTPVTKLNLYPDSASLVKPAGKEIAKAMDALIDRGARICHIGGHSLGAQLSGQIGRHMKNPLPHIIALDPAGPLFYPPEKCVDNILETDADCVEAIHTDGHMYGTLQKAGAVDIFVNGGVARQPGCQDVSNSFEVTTIRLSCSHDRAVFYAAEAIRNSSALLARQCQSLDAFNRGQCNNNPTIHIGQCDKSKRGSYFLRTSCHSPFGEGARGATT